VVVKAPSLKKREMYFEFKNKQKRFLDSVSEAGLMQSRAQPSPAPHRNALLLMIK
jgi:hypothetical protein